MMRSSGGQEHDSLAPLYSSVLKHFQDDLAGQIDFQQMFVLIEGILPFEVCLYYQVLPLFVEGSRMVLGMVSPYDRSASNYVRRLISYHHYTVTTHQISSEALQAALSAYLNYAGQHQTLERVPNQFAPHVLRRSHSKPPLDNTVQPTLVVDSPENLEDALQSDPPMTAETVIPEDVSPSQPESSAPAETHSPEGVDPPQGEARGAIHEPSDPIDIALDAASNADKDSGTEIDSAALNGVEVDRSEADSLAVDSLEANSSESDSLESDGFGIDRPESDDADPDNAEASVIDDQIFSLPAMSVDGAVTAPTVEQDSAADDVFPLSAPSAESEAVEDKEPDTASSQRVVPSVTAEPEDVVPPPAVEAPAEVGVAPANAASQPDFPLIPLIPTLALELNHLASPVEVLATLPPSELVQELLGRVLNRGIGRLYLERQANSGRVLWSQEGVVQSVLEALPIDRFEALIKELKQVVDLPAKPIHVPQRLDVERIFERDRILLRFRFMPSEHGEEATLQVLRGAALRFYQQQQLMLLERDALGIAKQLQGKLGELRDRAHAESSLSGARLEILPALSNLLKEIETEIHTMQSAIATVDASSRRRKPDA
ncbi:MAG: hypothetical protein AAFY26_03575 [Cyanobacteria bacterium J06638_22]